MTSRLLSTTTNPFDGGDVGLTCITDPASGNKAAVLVQGGQLISPDGGNRGTWGASNSFGLAATPTDVLVIQGSPTHTVRIRSIKLSGYASTGGQLVFFVIRRSSANSGGTASPRTPLLFDTADATNWAPTATVNTYTANPASLGISVGTAAIRRLCFNVITSTPDRAFDRFLRAQREIIRPARRLGFSLPQCGRRCLAWHNHSARRERHRRRGSKLR